MQERRQATRFPVLSVTVHQCIFTHLGKELWLAATALDLSVSGLCLVLSDSIDAGEKIYLLMTIAPEGKPPRDLEVNAVTAHCRPTEDGRWRVGIKFIDLLPEEQESLAEYLKP